MTESTPLPGDELKPPTSPKVIAAAVVAFLAPVGVSVVLAVIGFLATDDGRALTSSWPLVLQVAFYAAVAAVGGGLAGYRQPDERYRARRAITG
jgi:hypothetical protein